MNSNINKILFVVLSVIFIYLAFKSCDNNEEAMLNKASDDDSFDIYFIETNTQLKHYNHRQLCSIESAAKHNQYARINAFSLSNLLDQNNLIKNDELAGLLIREYKNIRFQYLKKNDLDDIVNGLPIENVFNSILMRDESNLKYNDRYKKYAELADILRLAILYRYSGVYIDLDMICLKKLNKLLIKDKTGMCREGSRVLNAFITSGHLKDEFIYETLIEMPKNYPADGKAKWGIIGMTPLLVTFRKNCLSLLLKNEKYGTRDKAYCKKLELFPDDLSAPFHWRNVRNIGFKPNQTIEISLLMNSYLIHFNSYMTGGKTFVEQLNTRNYFEYFASFNCPIVYDYVKSNGSELVSR